MSASMDLARLAAIETERYGRPEPIIPGMCPMCGMTGAHADRGECIDALRDRIATLEFALACEIRRRRERRKNS